MLGEPAKMCVIVANSHGLIIAAVGDTQKVCGWRVNSLIGKQIGRTLVPKRHRRAHETGMQAYRHTGDGPAFGRAIAIEALDARGKERPIWLTIFAYDTLVMAVMQARDEAV